MLEPNNRLQRTATTMQDVSMLLDNRPGALADMGEAMGRAGVSIEGGGAWVVDGTGAAQQSVATARDR